MIHKIYTLLLLILLLSGCASKSQPVTDRNNQLTQGKVQMHLKVGQSTKAEVLDHFGAPNVTTRDGTAQEMWVYQRSAYVQQSDSNASHWNILIFGTGSSNSGFESSYRMITLIIKFDKNDVVTDFKSRSSNF